MVSSGEHALSSSLTDMMTSLMVIFILLLVVYLNQAQDKREEETKKIVDTRDIVQEELRNRLVDYFQGVTVTQDAKDPLMLIVVVPDSRLSFAPNEFELNTESKQFLASFGPALTEVICNKRYRPYLNSLIVEGHTDSTAPMGKDADEYNLALSQKRSLFVMLELFRELETNRDCLLVLGSASGRGMTDLVRDEWGREIRERSRRVEFKLRLRSSKEDEVVRTLNISANDSPEDVENNDLTLKNKLRENDR